MKKLFSAALAALMLISLSASVLAADPTPLDGENAPNPATGLDQGEYSIGITGSYTPNTLVNVISVDIAWDAMRFEYKETDRGVWRPELHSYDDSATGTWLDVKSSISATNHSNTGVSATFSFTKEADVNITGTFYEKSGETYTALTSTEFILDTAEDTTYAAAPRAEAWLGISGDPIAEDKTLGTITVEIQKEQAQ